MEANRVKYNKIIGVDKDGLAVVLEDIFTYPNSNLHGATGYRMGVLTKEDVEAGKEDECLKELWQDAVANGYCEDGFKDRLEKANAECTRSEDGRLFPLDDPGFRADFAKALTDLNDEERQKLEQAMDIDEQFVTWNCERYGRCLGDLYSEADFKLLINSELLQKIIRAEEE